ncbi:hypothetical protein CJF42_04485 [Pseudoalteromonas sp. NBT06-2]|uniref:GNAT family N-acetyltransferase n=1 Tax=Pseudoalteromonas sp. NBT06-2 TaxID=2025950 RepID=UPI000BA5D493|nr:GNAT family N-acetyltransferase [Pseudoalteromonas sp. NBT06-2]PAJ75583.1 hypothetical protein CJF42_04485 [Pseudoalteromonas sp. NBT06-2]
MIRKISKSFAQLTTTELYQILKLRVDIFVVEQECAYPELDNLDMNVDTRHIMFYEGEELIAYARCLAPKVVFDTNPAIGRVLVSQKGRGRGLAQELMFESIRESESFWPNKNIKLSAQTYLLDFYKNLGFSPIGEAYLEDGIEHQDMFKDG